jgi:release factor glutamine methyltransferase
LQFIKPTNLGAAWQYFIANLEVVYPEKELQAIGSEIFSHFFGLGPADRVLAKDLALSAEQQQTLERVVGQLRQHVPLQYITGQASFFNLVIKVNESVLIPRPETEELVLWVLDTLRAEAGSLQVKFNLLDVGTGSGCIAITLASRLLEAKVWACDVSEKGLLIARENASSNNVAVDFFLCDVLNENPDIANLDLVVSNPPYIREAEKQHMLANVLDYEPPQALFVSDGDPLIFYRTIAQKANQWLKPGGWLLFEINENLGPETKECIEKEGFVNVELKQDINGRNRMIRARSLESEK